MTTGQRIAYLRKQLRESQSDLAKAIHVSASTIGMWETDQRAIKGDDLVSLGDHFDVTTDYLLGRPEPNDGLTVAAHRTEGVELTEQQKQDIEDYIEFQKAKYRKEHENKD